jgi:hypothetical protein
MCMALFGPFYFWKALLLIRITQHGTRPALYLWLTKTGLHEKGRFVCLSGESQA